MYGPEAEGVLSNAPNVITGCKVGTQLHQEMMEQKDLTILEANLFSAFL